MSDDLGAHRPDADPGAGGELEILGDAAVELEALGGIGLVDPFDGVAKPIKAFFIEGFGIGFRIAPIAGGDRGAAQAHFELALDRRELHLDAGHRQADIARPAMFGRAYKREGTAFGRPKAGQHRHSLAERLDRDRVHLVPDMLGKAGAGEEIHMQPREEFFAQKRFGAQEGRQFLEAPGHVEIGGGRDFAQVSHRRQNALGRRAALVDIERAAVIDDEAEIVVAAERVVPRQPVDENRRRIAQEAEIAGYHLLVGGPHRMGVDDPFGQSRRAGGEQDFGHVLALDGAMGARDRRFVDGKSEQF